MWRASEFARLSLLVAILGAASASAQSPPPRATPAPAAQPPAAPNAVDSAIQAAVRAAPATERAPPPVPLDQPVQLKPLNRDIWTDNDRDSAHRHAFDGPGDRHGLPPAALPLGWKVPF